MTINTPAACCSAEDTRLAAVLPDHRTRCGPSFADDDDDDEDDDDDDDVAGVVNPPFYSSFQILHRAVQIKKKPDVS